MTFVGQETRHDLAEPSASESLIRLQSKLSMWLWFHLNAHLGNDTLSSSLTRLLAGFSLRKSLSFFLIIG